MGKIAGGLFIAYEDIWLLEGVRTAFADYNGVLGLVSPIDLAIKVARAVWERTGISPADVRSVITTREPTKRWSARSSTSNSCATIVQQQRFSKCNQAGQVAYNKWVPSCAGP